MNKHLFITFEGIDGCGKTLMMKKTAAWLQSLGMDVVTTREPGGSNLGAAIRKMLLDSPKDAVDSRFEALCFAADRAHHCATIIGPALTKGKTVLCDRYLDSTIAYQCYGRGLDKDELTFLNTFAIHGLLPDLTILLQVSPQVALHRIGNEKDRIEQEDLSFFARVADGYLQLAEENPQRFVVINGEMDIPQVFAAVQSAISPRLKG